MLLCCSITWYNMMIIIQKHVKVYFQYYRDEPYATLTNSESFKSKIKITRDIPPDGNKKNVEIAVPVKYIRNFCINLEKLLINYKLNLILTWSSTCIISDSAGKETFPITHTKLYIALITLYQLKIMKSN